MNKLELLEYLINTSTKIVIMTGAGFSKASGIPDFRSSDGLYNSKDEIVSPEEILSHHFFINNNKEFYKFYFDKMLYPKAEPNLAHRKLVELEDKGRLLAIITQNIDGLHQKAGSKNVLELHGTVQRNYCMKCNELYLMNQLVKLKPEPLCNKCGGLIKPDVTLYEEMLNSEILDNALESVKNADLLIIAGSSMLVSPASSLPYYFRGKNMVIINLEETPLDKFANLVINDKIERVFPKIKIEQIKRD